MKAAIVIPARLHSTRLAEKLLLPLGGRTIIERVHERALGALRASEVIVATDSPAIAEVIVGVGGRVFMSGAAHQSGTERVAEAAGSLDADIIVNVQGDEPEIDPANIDALIELHESAMARGYFASTLACPFPDGFDAHDPASVKAVYGKPIAGVSRSFEALYFTRAPAPFSREGRGEHHLHVGVYAFGRGELLRFAATPQTRLERTERLEQLRILEMGEKIAVRIVERSMPGIDTQADYVRAVERFAAPGD